MPIFEDWRMTNWGTRFTPFRWVIPYLCGFKGKAIYLDVDTLLLSDISELWKINMNRNHVVSLLGNYSVMLLNCEALGQYSCFHDIKALRRGACIPRFAGPYNECAKTVAKSCLELSVDWNCLDGAGYLPNQTKLIHYTRKDTQPWAPYPERHLYVDHARPEIAKLWLDTYTEATAFPIEQSQSLPQPRI